MVLLPPNSSNEYIALVLHLPSESNSSIKIPLVGCIYPCLCLFLPQITLHKGQQTMAIKPSHFLTPTLYPTTTLSVTVFGLRVVFLEGFFSTGYGVFGTI